MEKCDECINAPSASPLWACRTGSVENGIVVQENTDRYRMDDIEGYYELFDLTYEIIHSYCSELKVGGCGYRQGYDKAGGKFWEEWTKKTFPGFYFVYLFCI